MQTNVYCVYILANEYNTTLYIGVTNDLKRRVWEHKNDFVEGFSKRYQTHKLVYYEQTNDAVVAIAREKQIKKWSRKKKNDLVEMMNPMWRNLSKDF